MSSRDYFPHVDGLRAVAVLSVLLFHLGVAGFGGGFVGVDVFLVISGFLITGLIVKELEETGRLSLRGFYFRRVRRIMPAFIVTLAGTSLLMSLILSPTHLERFGASLLWASLGISNIHFWLQADYFDTASKLKPLLHTWSLGVEEQFYLFWPMGLALCYRLGLKRVLALVMLVVGGVSLWINGPFSDGHMYLGGERFPQFTALFKDGRATIFFLLPFRIYEFVLGAILVWSARVWRPSRVLADGLFVLGAALIAYAVVYFNEHMLFPSYAGLIPCGGASLLILSGQVSRFSGLLTNRTMVLVGLMSYSLYLVHWPLTVAWDYLFSGIGTGATVVLISVSFVLAWVSWRYVERPFRRPEFWVQHRLAIAGGFVGVLLILLAGWSMKSSGGWRFRVPENVAHIEYQGASSDFCRDFYAGRGYPYYGRINGDRPADIVLMGDSHVRHYAEGVVKEFAEPRGLCVYLTGNSCFHLPGFTRTTAGENWSFMAPWSLDQSLREIRSAPTPPLVVLSHSWLWQLTIAAHMDEQGRALPGDLTEQDIIEGILKLKEELGEAPLLVIGQVPTTCGVDIYDVFTRPWPVQPWLTDLDQHMSTTSAVQYVEFNRKLKTAAEQSGQFYFIDPMDYLCRDGDCRNLDDEQRLIYSDTTHFSRSGSRFLVRMLLPEIERVYALRFATPGKHLSPATVRVKDAGDGS